MEDLQVRCAAVCISRGVYVRAVKWCRCAVSHFILLTGRLVPPSVLGHPLQTRVTRKGTSSHPGPSSPTVNGTFAPLPVCASHTWSGPKPVVWLQR